ncbi:MAG: cytochrome c3 family protein [Gammaproteobacteria bacterium]|nr:cytochrome c3 family protein [Gammaproteobacteria bacterium]
MLPAVAGADTIVGSDHDFSGDGWSGGEICVACHTPHNADTSVTNAPLWNHSLTTTSFTLYSSATMNATVGQPDGSSKLCLSCHDGTVALDSFGGKTGTSYIGGGQNLGTTLANDHPVSITYNTALATADGSLADPATAQVTIGTSGNGGRTKTGSISAIMAPDGKVQCSSCHDVHNTYTNGASLLVKSNAGSALCLTCHVK